MFFCCIQSSRAQTPAATITFAMPNYAVHEAATTATVTVSIARSEGASGVFAVECLASGGSATPDEDYTPVRTAVAFGPGETTKTFTIPILDDPFDEPNETIQLTLANPTCGAAITNGTALLIIVDNDIAHGELNFSAPEYIRSETNLSAQITVTRRGGSEGIVSVQFHTSNDTAGTAATAGLDYLAASGTLTFVHGETNKTFSVSIIADAVVESDETVLLVLTNATGGATFPGGWPTAEARLTITDSDSPSTARPTIQSYDRSGSVLRFGFSGEPPFDYYVEFTESIPSGTWLNLTNFRAKNQTIEAVVTDSLTNGATRFYRIRKEECQCD
jgi:hypothetical protein